MAMIPFKAAMCAHLAHHGVTLVHVWRNGRVTNAMLELSPSASPRLKAGSSAADVSPGLMLATHATGVGPDDLSAVIDGLQRIGFGAYRLFVLEYMLGMMAKGMSRGS